MIAHSMGGLDAHYALAKVTGFAGRVASLVTIGTPHRGSPVADAIADRTDPLSAYIPLLFRQQLELNAGALDDLTTKVCIAFDESTPDSDGVRYIEVAGDASLGGQELFLFELAAMIGNLKGEVNDGVVTLSSALREGHEHLGNWPVDHAGEIGWTRPSLLAGVIPFDSPAMRGTWPATTRSYRPSRKSCACDRARRQVRSPPACNPAFYLDDARAV